MTLEEAKEILTKEGWDSFQDLSYRPRGFKNPEWEKAIVAEALEVCYDNHILPLILKDKLSKRLKTLKAEYDKHHKEKEDREITMSDANRVVDEMIAESPSLNEKFKSLNDSLLDEQAKKIKELELRNEKLNEKVVSLGKDLCAERYTSKLLKKKDKEIKAANKRIERLLDTLSHRNTEIFNLHETLKEKGKTIIGQKNIIDDYTASDHAKDEMIAGLRKELAVAKSKFIVKDEFLPYGAEYRDNHNAIIFKDGKQRKGLHVGVDKGAEEGDKTYVGVFNIFNEVPICTEPLTEEHLIEIANSLFRKKK